MAQVYTLFVVKDIPATVDFYVQAYGAEDPRVRNDSAGNPSHGEVYLFGHRIGFTPDVRPGSSDLPARVRALAAKDSRGAGVALYVSLPSGEEFLDYYGRARERGAKVLTEPEEQMMGGARSFFALEDPNGYVLYVDGPLPTTPD
ncbi:MAG: VOC family protein [Dehalococcoidia bacterium]